MSLSDHATSIFLVSSRSRDALAETKQACPQRAVAQLVYEKDTT